MSPLNFTHILTQAVDELSESESYKGLFHQHTDGNPLPSAKALRDIIELARAIIFPGYFGNSTVNSRTVTYHIGVNVERLFDLLTEQILAGLCFAGDGECNCCTELQREEAALLAAKFISNLPAMRRVLATDVEAAYNGDPAAQSFGEVISCYPAIRAISNYRIAHELLKLGVPLIPRIITEMAHSETGIDIHPGAEIGGYFTIDHGTGVVIGETCIIGNNVLNVKLYRCDPRCQEASTGRRRQAHQGHSPPSHSGRQCDSLFQRHHIGTYHHRTRSHCGRQHLGDGGCSGRSENCTDKGEEMRSLKPRLKGNIAAFVRHLCLSRQTQVSNTTNTGV